MTKLPDMPEVGPDEGEIERHDAHYRLNPSGHKELVIQKKGEQDEETLNELAESLMEMADSYDEPEDAEEPEDISHYDGLEDDDEFERGNESWRNFTPESDMLSRRIVIYYGDRGIPDDSVLDAVSNSLGVRVKQIDVEEEPASTWNVPENFGYFWAESDTDLPCYTTAEGQTPNGEWIAIVEPHEDLESYEDEEESVEPGEYNNLEDADEFGHKRDDCQHCHGAGQIISSLYEDDILVDCPHCSARNPDDYYRPNLDEDIAFGGPAPAMSPEQQGYQRDFRPQTPAAYVDTGPVQVSSDHETERINQDSPNNFTSSTAQVADGPELSRAKSKIRSSTIRGTSPRNKYISGTNGTGLDYGATHSESFTGTASIAIGNYEVLGNNEVTDASESLMAKRKLLREWEPQFAGGGDYDPGDYQMPSPPGDGVAERKPKKSKVGAYDTATSNKGKVWPRKHNETAAMCDVDTDGVEHKPQGGHESSHGEPTDGHQSELGHNWPNQPKNTGSGVAEPFAGNRWSDGGVLSGGSGADDEHYKAGGPGLPKAGTITGTKGPQNGQPQEGKWSPGLFATMMEGDLDIQSLFDAYAADGREAVCVEDFELLLRAHGSKVQINEQSLLHLMRNNSQFLFYEGVDANGPYWVPTPLAEGKKPFPGAAPLFGSDDSGSDDSDSDNSGSDSDDSDSGQSSGSGKPWENSEEEECEEDCVKEGSRRRPFSEGRNRGRGRTINEFQRRSPEDEARLYQSGVTDDPTMIPPGTLNAGRISANPLDSIPDDDFEPGLPGDFDMADPVGGDEFGGEFGGGSPYDSLDDGPDTSGPGQFGMHNASNEACPECGYEGPGGEESCPECGAVMGGPGEESVYGPSTMHPPGGLPSDIDDEDEFFNDAYSSDVGEFDESDFDDE